MLAVLQRCCLLTLISLSTYIITIITPLDQTSVNHFCFPLMFPTVSLLLFAGNLY